MREIEEAANRLLGLRHSNELLGSGCQYLWKEISVGNPSDYVDGYGMGGGYYLIPQQRRKPAANIAKRRRAKPPPLQGIKNMSKVRRARLP